ncbi:ABC transporter permease [Chelatococcus sp. GCM10030263]|uniref:ABC transporter permease n=1 Tax=Chelatococcus sp. GCM10030263 TaxID=3273387 RepID=UPI003621625A
MTIDLFPDLRAPLARMTNDAVDALVTQYGALFETISTAILSVLLVVEHGLRAVPPVVLIAAVGAIAFYASRKPFFSVAAALGMWLIGALGMWDQAMQTLAIILVAVAISVVIGMPLGIAAASSAAVRRILMPLLDLMQTIPSFVYLIPAAMLFGLGKVPAILATVVYAAPPLIRLTDLGIREVDYAVVEASRAFGATRWQILSGVQIPLSLPAIMQGINQTTMLALSMVVIASMIGARGVGETVLLGLQRNDSGMGLVGGLTIVVLAVVIDRITQAYGQRLQRHRKAGA